MSDAAAACVAAPIILRAAALRAAAGACVASRRVFLRDMARYGLCSAMALGLDWGALGGLIKIGAPPLIAAAIGFSLGMAVTYVLSITLVYADRRRDTPWREAAVFVAIGIVGLGINQLSLWALMASLGLAAPIAKAPTAGVVFLFNFLVRRAFLFSRPIS